jgi:hypothetical protein
LYPEEDAKEQQQNGSSGRAFSAEKVRPLNGASLCEAAGLQGACACASMNC